MSKKKEINIVFVALREEFPGHKDIDHLLPFLYFLNKSNEFKFTARLIILENESNYKKNLDPRIKLLFGLKNLDIKFLFKNNFLFNMKKVLDSKNSIPVLGKYLDKLFQKLYLKYLEIKIKKINIKDKLGKVFSKSTCPLIITLHKNHKAQKMVSNIQKINSRAKWAVIPHGTHLLVNKMVTDENLDKIQKKNKKNSYNKIDFNLTTSKWDLEDDVSNGMPRKKSFVIGSPRYCKEWLIIKSSLGVDGNKVIVNKKYKVKILFFLPKKFINIFWAEAIRTIDFISSYKNIELILIDYDPYYSKLPKYIKKRSNVTLLSISKEYSTSKVIEWADIILHVGSSLIFEFLIKEKISVFPSYLTSNTQISDRYHAGFNLSNRDELRTLCNQAVSSLKNLKKNYKKKCKRANKKYIDDFVNANLPSVPLNIVKILSKVRNSFNV